MSVIKYLDRIRKIDKLIRLEATGSPKDLSKKIGVSERTVYDYISYMRELGAPIEFSEIHNSYIYLSEGKIELGFVDYLTKEEMSKTYGGIKNLHFFMTAKIFQYD